MEKKSLIITRPGKAEDYNFIMATWLRGLYYGNEWFGSIDKDIYMKKYHEVIDAILGKPTTRILVSCLKDDHDIVLGYSVLDGPILHWVFIKHAWRNIGILKDLVPDTIKTVTHLTRVGKSIKPKDVEFNPFLI